MIYLPRERERERIEETQNIKYNRTRPYFNIGQCPACIPTRPSLIGNQKYTYIFIFLKKKKKESLTSFITTNSYETLPTFGEIQTKNLLNLGGRLYH